MEKLLNQKTLMISTINQEGRPCISYAPYMKTEEKIYIYISKTAEHYHNILGHPDISVMIIEDEISAKTIFARVRISFEGVARKLETIPEEIWKSFEDTQRSELLQVLKEMNFDMFEITLQTGRLVEGFGKAYNLSFNEGEWSKNQVMGLGHDK